MPSEQQSSHTNQNATRVPKGNLQRFSQSSHTNQNATRVPKGNLQRFSREMTKQLLYFGKLLM